MRFFKLACFVCIVSSLFFSCHTYFFQPVKKQLEGTWIKSPLDAAKQEEWTFTDDGKLYIVNYDIDFPNTTRDTTYSCKDGTKDYIDWQIENKVTKHFLYTDEWPPFCSAETNAKWLIIKLNKSILYMSSQENVKTRGSWQQGFTKK